MTTKPTSGPDAGLDALHTEERESALTFPTSTGGKATAIYPIEFALATAR